MYRWMNRWMDGCLQITYYSKIQVIIQHVIK